ncbi:Acetyl/propionyl-CoA carboxylase alpha subunit [Gaiella occulta]|uniref:Acetyl/propionyl-CoA carboxylase alpha subunit n=1 Tax=Gaiella occulta TaxID=1002870 RepID=A0A7M2Z0N5_9ACTN|nr:biotin carboxylase N-terminal domain-containing protein [Gaiella occulta]RDI75361.1 Acetyl/propionyl-CoA carboxylase alpha subunit [Gaiella occulta]
MAVRTLLVANRGEIALRVFRTCRRLGIRTVAVATRADRGSLHARSADATVEISSYLSGAEHLRAAAAAAADAVHPGYGFLAESAAFAASVEEAGLTWVGPPPAALRLGGDKLAAKRVAREAGVPTLPEGVPELVGYPLLVKAAAGGGGRGMRVVRSPDALEESLAAARREAEAAFGDGTVYCERFLERPRHVEAQLLADAAVVYVLGLRDCSVQRRHQKVVEEAPPNLDAEAARSIRAAAAAFAAAIGYRGAGTAEFLVDGRDVYFLELNGRIQVEHPVTESVTGLDLVELQLRVATGELLELGEVGERGHAVEVRLYAEDPVTFLPQAGRLVSLVLPQGIRVDAGVESGDEIGTAYDPLLAKLIAHGATRDEALDRLGAALDATRADGLTTNLPFLRWLVAHPAFRAAELSTAFLVDHPPLSAPPLRRLPPPFAGAWRLNLPAPAPAPAPPPSAEGGGAAPGPGVANAVTAAMPGTVIRVEVEAGETVEARQTLVVLEAMKMEMPVPAPFAATVTAVRVAPGDQVASGAALVELEPA